MKRFVALLASLPACAAIASDQGTWAPKALFQLEKDGLRETMLFVSGMSYGLTEYSKELERTGKAKLFCIPGRGFVESPMIFDILNKRHAGQTITAEQATSTVLAGLKERYSCK